jgi:F-type H+-transporting ATPase subunit b
MAAGNSNVVIVAQAAPADALQQGAVVEDQAAQGAEHAVENAIGETHATTAAAGGEEHALFPPFDASSFAGQLIWLAITFGFLYVLMSRAALPRIGGILEQRRVRIEGDLREADRLRQETDRAIASYEAALAEARQRAHGIAEETRQSIKADIEGKRSGVEAELAQKLSTAEASIAASKTTSLGNVDAIAAEIAQTLVGQLTGEVSASAARDAVAAVAKG